MAYKYNLNSENTTIYTELKLKENDELITFAFYHKFIKELFYILDNYDDMKICHQILKSELSKFCLKISSLDNKVNYKEFVLGFFNYIKDNENLNEILDFYSFINNYIGVFDDVLNDLSLAEIINKKSLSFADKSNLWCMIDEYLDGVLDFVSDINGIENAEKIVNELSNIINSFISFINTDYFSIQDFNYNLKKITMEFIKEKIVSNELNLDKIENGPLYDVYNAFNEVGKSILKFSFPYIISDFVDYIDPFAIKEEVRNSVDMSSFKFDIEIGKFYRKYRKLRKYYNNLTEDDNVKTLTKNNK